jgi:4a-hydroxytetrahydrobiopterin dehydratase
MKHALLAQDFDLQGTLPLWRYDPSQKKILREFVFANFEQAFAFMGLCAEYAQEIDHHPDWSNAWNKVRVELTTHSSNGLTLLDIQLAQAMDSFALEIQP